MFSELILQACNACVVSLIFTKKEIIFEFCELFCQFGGLLGHISYLLE